MPRRWKDKNDPYKKHFVGMTGIDDGVSIHRALRKINRNCRWVLNLVIRAQLNVSCLISTRIQCKWSFCYGTLSFIDLRKKKKAQD